MPRRHIIRTHGDVREFPRYSISEAAFYLRIPATTLRAWTCGQDYITVEGKHRRFLPLVKLADEKHRLMSFFNLVEAHVLRSTTEQEGVPLQNVRKALDYVQAEIPREHPLITHEFEVSGKEVFVRYLDATIRAAQQQGQTVMREILEKYLKRIYRDLEGLPTRVEPINSRRLAIDPLFFSGKPIVKDKGVAASVLCGRKKSGEGIREIARDYGLTDIEVQEAIEDYEWAAAA